MIDDKSETESSVNRREEEEACRVEGVSPDI